MLLNFNGKFNNVLLKRKEKKENVFVCNGKLMNVRTQDNGINCVKIK